jgi:hypothetical protein
MPVREAPAQPAPPPAHEESVRRNPYPAEKARGGEIILDTPARRAVFIAGLIGAVALAIFLALIGLSR